MNNPKRLGQSNLLFYIGKWILLGTAVAVLAGAATFVFLAALDWATETRISHPYLLWFLPIAGFAVGWIYLRFGQQVEGGNNLLIDEIHDPKNTIPLRLVPLILGGTVLSHLFGASVGREGTAVQMGGALADQITHIFRLNRDDRRIILMSGISAGFAAVFGTPLAGAIFGLEVLAIGRLRHDAIFPCVIAAVIGDRMTLLLGAHHTHYTVSVVPNPTLWSMLSVIIAGAVFGIVGMLFARATHDLGAWMKARISYAPLRPLTGGLLIALVAASFDVDRYLGLGIPTIVAAFQQPLDFSDFAGKIVFTVISLGSGFKGGEVTPLFYIGATLGNALAPILSMPESFLAGIGFVAVFAGAANTPIASTLMALELFGADIGIYALIACVTSYLFSGARGIYRAQRH